MIKYSLILTQRHIIPKNEYTDSQLYNLPDEKWVLVEDIYSYDDVFIWKKRYWDNIENIKII